MQDRVKKEGTHERPSALSAWYRKTLGPKVAITNIDWVITSIQNRDSTTRYMIIEEKNVSSFEHSYIGLGEARSLREIKEDITKENIPIFVVFVRDNDISQGVLVYEFRSNDVDNKSNWIQLGDSWYVNVKEFAQSFSEDDFIDLIRRTIKVEERKK